MTDTRDDRSDQQARGQLASIRDMVAALECDYDRLAELRQEREGFESAHGDARDWPAADELAELEAAAGDCESEEQARERIEEDPLSVEVRTDWHSPGATDASSTPAEYRILLCTGGPACQVVGDLNEHGEPTTARLQHQDWFTPWADCPLDCEDEEALLTYARCFYFGS
jgi:hypothetical protein